MGVQRASLQATHSHQTLPKTPTYLELRAFTQSHLRLLATIPLIPQHRIIHYMGQADSLRLQMAVQGLVLVLTRYPWFALSDVWFEHSDYLRNLWWWLSRDVGTTRLSQHIATLYLGLVPFLPDLRQSAVWYQSLQKVVTTYWQTSSSKSPGSSITQAWALRCWESTPALQSMEMQQWRYSLRSHLRGMQLWALRSLYDQNHRTQTWLQHRKQSLHRDILNLLTDPDPEIHQEIRHIFATPTDLDGFDRWFGRMADERWWVRETAAIVLQRWGKVAIPSLLSRLEHPDNSIQAQSAYVLMGMVSVLETPESQQILARVLAKTSSPSVLSGLVQVVGRLRVLQPTLRRVWARKLETGSRLLRQTMIQQMLRNPGPFRSLIKPALQQELRHADWRWQQQAVLALQKRREVVLLAEVMGQSHRHIRVRGEAIAAMGHMGTKARPYLTQLQQLLESDSWRIRYAAAEAFSRLGVLGNMAIPSLARTISDKNWGVRAASAAALAKMGPSALDVLEPLLQDASARTRVMAVDAIGKMKGSSPRRIRLLGQVLQQDSSVMVRYEAILAMNPMVDMIQRILPTLQKALRDRDWGIRKQAILLLQRGRRIQTFRTLVLSLARQDSSSAVREVAVAALAQLQGVAETSLIQALSDPHWRIRWRVLQTIAQHVAKTGTFSEPLQQAVKQRWTDRVAQVQKAAMFTLLAWRNQGDALWGEAWTSPHSSVRVLAALTRLLRSFDPTAWSIVTTQLFHASLVTRFRTLSAMRSLLPDFLAFFDDCMASSRRKTISGAWCRYVVTLTQRELSDTAASYNWKNLKSWKGPVLWLRLLREVFAMSESSLQPVASQIAQILLRHRLVSRQEMMDLLRHPDTLGWKNWVSCDTWKGQSP